MGEHHRDLFLCRLQLMEPSHRRVRAARDLDPVVARVAAELVDDGLTGQRILDGEEQDRCGQGGGRMSSVSAAWDR